MPIESRPCFAFLCVLVHFSSVPGARPQDRFIGHISLMDDKETHHSHVEDTTDKAFVVPLKGAEPIISSNQCVSHIVLHNCKEVGHDPHQDHDNCEFMAAKVELSSRREVDKGQTSAAGVISMMKIRRNRKLGAPALTVSQCVPHPSRRQVTDTPWFNLDYEPPKLHPGAHN